MPCGSWHEQAITEMQSVGLISGYPDGAFRPDAAITASEFVAITARCAELQPVRGQASYWASGDMQAALEAGWL